MEGLGFDEVDEEAPGEVGGEEEAEGCAFGVRALVVAVEGEGKCDEEEDLVELGWVAGDSVAEVDAPGEGGGGAVGVVGEAGEEAADAAYGDAEAEGDGEEISGAGVDVADALGEFDGDPSAEEAADDGLAAGEEEGSPGELGERDLFEEAEDAGAEHGSDGGGGDDNPAAVVGEEVAGAVAGLAIEEIAGEVAEGFEESVEGGMRSEVQGAVSLYCGSRIRWDFLGG